MFDPHTRESRGFAFVTMVRPEDADAAMQVLNGFELHGRAMSVNMVGHDRDSLLLNDMAVGRINRSVTNSTCVLNMLKGPSRPC